MASDPILLEAGRWLGMASGILFVLMLLGLRLGWGIRYRLVGVTSFTTLLAISCVAFAISYRPRIAVPGAVSVPIVYDNGSDLVIAAAPAGLSDAAVAPSLEQVALNLRGSGRNTSDGLVTVRLRRIEPQSEGLDRPLVLAELQRNLRTGELQPL
ncbi:MAG: Ycf51 family protein [Cyanobacteriota bacterium]|nr:Ycf51 family protein [Cyanobacteriota bacterium]